MTHEQDTAYIVGMAAMLNAQVAGMTAENMQRQSVGESMAYVERDFQMALDLSGLHHNAIMQLFGS